MYDNESQRISQLFSFASIYYKEYFFINPLCQLYLKGLPKDSLPVIICLVRLESFAAPQPTCSLFDPSGGGEPP
jgi:hypothetical protein